MPKRIVIVKKQKTKKKQPTVKWISVIRISDKRGSTIRKNIEGNKLKDSRPFCTVFVTKSCKYDKCRHKIHLKV